MARLALEKEWKLENWFGLVLFVYMFVGFATLDSSTKFWISIGLGILFYAVSFFYQRKKKSAEWYFERERLRQALLEYRSSILWLWIVVPTLISFLAFAYLWPEDYDDLGLPTFISEQLTSLSRLVKDFTWLFIVFIEMAFVFLFPSLMANDFQYYLAKVCIIVSREEQANLSKLKFLFLGLEAYNKFLRRNFRLQISDRMKIYSRITCDNKIELNEWCDSLAKSFENGDMLYPARYLSTKINDNPERFLVKENVGQKIREESVWITPVIAIAVTVLLRLLFPNG